MCGCKRHEDPTAPCTCNCPGHPGRPRPAYLVRVKAERVPDEEWRQALRQGFKALEGHAQRLRNGGTRGMSQAEVDLGNALERLVVLHAREGRGV